MSRSTKVFAILLAVYLVLTAAIMLRTPVLDVDSWIIDMQLRHRHGELYPWIHTYVMFGQRGPATLAALPWFAWMAHRRRSAQPLVMLVVALVVLNLSVGIVKLATGRLGPRGGHPVDALFDGGNIYPSGHVSNAVVLYGLIALVAAPRYRTAVVAVGTFLTVTVGIGTLFLNTHWLTDVIGGILAGGLVLCSLQWLVPPAERLLARAAAGVRIARGRRRPVTIEVDGGAVHGGVAHPGVLSGASAQHPRSLAS